MTQNGQIEQEKYEDFCKLVYANLISVWAQMAKLFFFNDQNAFLFCLKSAVSVDNKSFWILKQVG